MPYGRRGRGRIGVLVWVALLGGSRGALAADIPATPADIDEKLVAMLPGDRLLLGSGEYQGLVLDGLVGDGTQRFTIEGNPDGGARIVSPAGGAAVTLSNVSNLELTNLELDGQGLAGVTGILAAGEAGAFTTSVTVSACTFNGYDGAGSAAVRTELPSWGWMLRSNEIDVAAAGFQLGLSDGTAPFLGGMIDANLFRDLLGAPLVIAPLAEFTPPAGFPDFTPATVVRGNVFVRADVADPERASPSVRLGGFAGSAAASPAYQVYGNVFLRNPDGQALLSSGASLHAHDNILVDAGGAAIEVVTEPAASAAAEAWIYDNTVYATGRGIVLPEVSPPELWVAGNAVFSDEPLVNVGQGTNVVAAVHAAPEYVLSPSITPGEMDFYPLPGGALRGGAIDAAHVSGDLEYDLDFNGTRRSFTWRGAYEGGLDENPGWAIDVGFIFAPPPVGGGGGTGGAAGASGAGAESGAAGAHSGGAHSGAGASDAGEGGTPPATQGGAAPAAAGTSQGGGRTDEAGASSGGRGVRSIDDKKGCGCRAAGAPSGALGPLAAVLGALVLARRRCRPRVSERRQSRRAGVMP